jgi:hypothetical protein
VLGDRLTASEAAASTAGNPLASSVKDGGAVSRRKSTSQSCRYGRSNMDDLDGREPMAS